MKAICVVGCDPELVVENLNGKLVGAPDLKGLTGTKESPQEIDGGAIHSDNVMLEFNTRPAVTSKDMVENIGVVLKQTAQIVGDHKLVVRASADYPKEALTHKDSQEFGCDSDFNAWDYSVNEIEEDAAEKSFRSAGGHIHVGSTSESEGLLLDDEGKIRVIRAMDVFLGITSVILDRDETSIARRTLYGKAGAYRFKSYGLEYRSLGNFWVKSPKLVELMFNLTNFCVRFCMEHRDEELIGILGQGTIQEVINTSDRVKARAIFEDLTSKYLPKEILGQIKKLESFSCDFYKEWNLS